MPTVYFTPTDFNQAQVETILDYLNSTDDAKEMAARIELENERDIGERLSIRIIRERKNLGGVFTNLQQVYDIDYIGPERFTEIAISLLELQLPNNSVPFYPSFETLLRQMDTMQRELAQLRSCLSQSNLDKEANNGVIATPLETQHRVQINVLQADAFLGQHITLDIYAFNERDNTPLVDQSVTLSTNWGVLQYQQGYSSQQDAVVEIKTDIEGHAKVRLRSPTYESLTQEQQLALEAALQTLDASAATPASILSQLENLVFLYRQVNNRELRKAIDIYFNAQKNQIIESINRRFYSDAWRVNNALISAYIHKENLTTDMGHARGASNGTVASMSTVKVRLKDWVGAWYQTYLDVLDQGNAFSQRIQSASSNDVNGQVLANGVLSEITRWTQDESGIAGMIISEKATEAAVLKFLADDIQHLPDQQQLQLYSTLSLAVKPGAVTQIGTLKAVADSQITLAEDLNVRVANVEGVSTAIENLQENINSFNTQYSDFQGSITNFETKIESFNTDRDAFDLSYIDFIEKVEQVNVDLGSFQVDYTQFSTNFIEFNNSMVNIQTDIVTLKENVLRLGDRVIDPVVGPFTGPVIGPDRT